MKVIRYVVTFVDGANSGNLAADAIATTVEASIVSSTDNLAFLHVPAENTGYLEQILEQDARVSKYEKQDSRYGDDSFYVTCEISEIDAKSLKTAVEGVEDNNRINDAKWTDWSGAEDVEDVYSVDLCPQGRAIIERAIKSNISFTLPFGDMRFPVVSGVATTSEQNWHISK